MDLAPAPPGSRSVRGDAYEGVRVDVAAAELTLGVELARGGASVVFRGAFGGVDVAVKKPCLATRADMDRYHTELKLVRRVAQARARATRGVQRVCWWGCGGAKRNACACARAPPDAPARARSSLRHPNVLGITAARAWPPEYYLIFPFMARTLSASRSLHALLGFLAAEERRMSV